MSEIAKMLGVSRQRVNQLVADYEDFPPPEAELAAGRIWSRTAVEEWITQHPDRKSGRPEALVGMEPRDFRVRVLRRRRERVPTFQRFTEKARTAIAKAQEEARLLRHNYVGTEHLLLGLFAENDSLASEVLYGLGVGVETCREHLIALIGLGPSEPTGAIPFTPRSKKVLELALREALTLGDNFVGTEHLLLALVREGEGVGAQILEKCGLAKSDARQAVMTAIQEPEIERPRHPGFSFNVNRDLARKLDQVGERLNELERRIKTDE
jgi:predicted DNA-binding transcriptional regulator AlpA